MDRYSTYPVRELSKILDQLPEPAQVIILLNVGLESLEILADPDTHIGQLIRSPYFLRELSMVHVLPITTDFDHFLDLSEMSIQDLLEYSISVNDLRVVRDILDREDPNSWTKLNYNSALIVASSVGDLISAEYLLRLGGNAPRAPTVAAKNGNLEMYKLLSGIDKSPGLSLITAASEGHFNVVEYLVNKGVYDLDLAISYAERNKQYAMVSYLKSVQKEMGS